MKKILVLFFIFSNCLLKVNAQNEYKSFFVIGKPCPDFTFSKVDNFPKKTISLSDFKGKWLILDFWNKACSGCIASFPHINQDQKKYKDNIQFLLIGLQDADGEVNVLWNRIKKSLNLVLPVVFDSLFSDNDRVPELLHGNPLIIVIDPDGIVRGSGPDLKNYIGANLDSLTFDRRPKLRDFYRENFERQNTKMTYDRQKPFMVDNNGGYDGDFLYRSLLAIWKSSANPWIRTKIINNEDPQFEAIGVNGKELFKYAYMGQLGIKYTDSLHGKFWPELELHLKDTSILCGRGSKEIINNSYDSRNLVYSYSLIVPPNRSDRLSKMRIMQNDLTNYFGFSVAIEEKEMPCLRLLSIDTAREKLRAKNIPKESPRAIGQSMKFGIRSFYDISMDNFCMELIYAMNLELGFANGPLIDDTNINFNVDVNLDYTPKDFDSFLSSLRKNGLDMVRGTKKMKVIVLRD